MKRAFYVTDGGLSFLLLVDCVVPLEVYPFKRGRCKCCVASLIRNCVAGELYTTRSWGNSCVFSNDLTNALGGLSFTAHIIPFMSNKEVVNNSFTVIVLIRL